MKSFWIALAMYSKLPAKRVEWDKKSLSWALCWFPAVGIAAGALLFGWLWLAGVLGLGAPLRAAVGRLCWALAQRADAVERIFCGIPMTLKGDSEWN